MRLVVAIESANKVKAHLFRCCSRLPVRINGSIRRHAKKGGKHYCVGVEAADHTMSGAPAEVNKGAVLTRAARRRGLL